MLELTVCPGCGLELPAGGFAIDRRFNASGECLQVSQELAAYTLSLGDPAFLHQHFVDAYAAQHQSATAPPIRTAFALIGLFLTFERGFTGRQAQLAHIELGRRAKGDWPRFPAPAGRVGLTVQDVLKAEPGPQRDEALMAWALAVWRWWTPAHGWAREACGEFPTPRK